MRIRLWNGSVVEVFRYGVTLLLRRCWLADGGYLDLCCACARGVFHRARAAVGSGVAGARWREIDEAGEARDDPAFS